jgi:uncharacterized protein (DUF983 family)
MSFLILGGYQTMNYKKNFLTKISIAIFACLFSASLNLYAGDFVCSKPDCNKTFTQKVHLATHIKSIHEGIKHKCPHCDNTYAYQSNLNKHIDSIHKGIKHKCSHCDKSYTQKCHLKRHLRRKHPDHEQEIAEILLSMTEEQPRKRRRIE